MTPLGLLAVGNCLVFLVFVVLARALRAMIPLGGMLRPPLRRPLHPSPQLLWIRCFPRCCPLWLAGPVPLSSVLPAWTPRTSFLELLAAVAALFVRLAGAARPSLRSRPRPGRGFQHSLTRAAPPGLLVGPVGHPNALAPRAPASLPCAPAHDGRARGLDTSSSPQRPSGAGIALAAHTNQPPASLPPVLRLRWLPHALQQGAGVVGCVRCGQMAPTAAKAAVTACTGWADRLPSRVRTLVQIPPRHPRGARSAELEPLHRRRVAELGRTSPASQEPG